MIDTDDNMWFAGDQIDFSWTVDDFVDVKHGKDRDVDGCFCLECREFFPFAEANRPHNQFMCYKCRNF